MSSTAGISSFVGWHMVWILTGGMYGALIPIVVYEESEN